MKTLVELTYDQGSGRAFCLILEKGSYLREKETLVSLFQNKGRLLIAETESVTSENWKKITCEAGTLISTKIRHGSYIAIGDTTAILQGMYLSEPKLIRTMALVNPHTRAHPTLWTELIDKLESWLPLGLPLRISGRVFDSRAELHRMRCPSLIVTLPTASSFEITQAKQLAHAMPTAWYTHLSDINEIAEVIVTFQDVPAKCPQKARAA